jgi:DNA polymerase III subunit gamma/tau
MAYKALYREWRPKIFDDVIGQDHIITTLKNQIKFANIAHAYLFTGIRGTGKTSTAKIFARAVNCLYLKEYNPCNECEICLGILSENIMDVIEIDAASNNGVDHIREIRENVKYPPSKGRFKVYIIDEVHMLSAGAFNALLKTLEEPPEHVIFILATTESQKLPATILSRCQRFDFKPVNTKAIMDRLNSICDSIDIECEEEALRIISIHAEGALRDALSILEQCITSPMEKLTYSHVVHTLGAVNYDVLFSLTEYIAEEEPSKALEWVHHIIMEGKDVQLLTKDLIRHFRNLLMAKMEVDLEYILSVSKETLERIRQQSKILESNWIISSLHILSETESKMKFAAYPRILLEVSLVTMCRRELDESIEGLIERVKELEYIVNSGENKESKKMPVFKEKPELEEKLPQEKKVSLDTVLEEENILEKAMAEKKKNGNFNEIENKWKDILERIRLDKKPLIHNNLKKGILADLGENTLTICFKEEYDFYKEKLEKEKEYISSIVEKITGQKVKISFILENKGTPGKQIQMGDILNKLNHAAGNRLEVIEE